MTKKILSIMALATFMACGQDEVDQRIGQDQYLLCADPPCDKNFCEDVCTPFSLCNKSCRGASSSSTCGSFGVCDELSDSDSDGVNNHEDNCPWDPNPEQGDCDDDTIGNVCDPKDNSFYCDSQSLVICYIDTDHHGLWDTIEIWGEKTCYSECLTAPCKKKVLMDEIYCGVWDDTLDCCAAVYDKILCTSYWHHNRCGGPRCNS